MDKITDAELTTLRILLQSASQQMLLAQRGQAAVQDYEAKIKAIYSLNDKDGVNMETGEIKKVVLKEEQHAQEEDARVPQAHDPERA